MSGKVYRVILDRPAQKAMEKLPKDLRQRLTKAMMALGHDPRPNGYTQLKGRYRLFRIRVGGWRIIYDIQDEQLIILVVDVGPRGSIYEKY